MIRRSPPKPPQRTRSLPDDGRRRWPPTSVGSSSSPPTAKRDSNWRNRSAPPAIFGARMRPSPCLGPTPAIAWRSRRGRAPSSIDTRRSRSAPNSVPLEDTTVRNCSMCANVRVRSQQHSAPLAAPRWRRQEAISSPLAPTSAIRRARGRGWQSADCSDARSGRGRRVVASRRCRRHHDGIPRANGMAPGGLLDRLDRARASGGARESRDARSAPDRYRCVRRRRARVLAAIDGRACRLAGSVRRQCEAPNYSVGQPHAQRTAQAGARDPLG